MATAEAAKSSSWNLPNILTGVRMVMVPVFGWMLLAHADPSAPSFQAWRYATTAVFVLAILTDMADGRIARRYGLVTNFGKLWDPIADKALTGMAFVGLSILGELPWWVTIIILVREIGITILRWGILKYGVMAANRGGKAKTVIQSIALGLYLLYLPNMPTLIQWAGWFAMGVAFVITVVTGIDYLVSAWRLRRDALNGASTSSAAGVSGGRTDAPGSEHSADPTGSPTDDATAPKTGSS